MPNCRQATASTSRWSLWSSSSEVSDVIMRGDPGPMGTMLDKLIDGH